MELARSLKAIGRANLESFLKIYELKVVDDADLDFSFPSQAIADSLTNGIRLFNVSLYGRQAFDMLRERLDAAGEQALVVVAAGNQGIDLNGNQSFDGCGAQKPHREQNNTGFGI
jgi:hypothetical protein